jgi:hypothetical protein
LKPSSRPEESTGVSLERASAAAEGESVEPTEDILEQIEQEIGQDDPPEGTLF